MAEENITFRITSTQEGVEVTPENIGLRRMLTLLGAFEDAVLAGDPSFSGRSPLMLRAITDGSCVVELDPTEEGRKRSESLLSAVRHGDGAGVLTPAELKALRALNKSAGEMGVSVAVSSGNAPPVTFDGQLKIARPVRERLMERTSVVGTYAGQTVGTNTVKLDQLGGGVVTLKGLTADKLVWFSARHGDKPNQRFRATGWGEYDHRKVLAEMKVTDDDVDIVRGLTTGLLKALSTANEGIDASKFLHEVKR